MLLNTRKSPPKKRFIPIDDLVALHVHRVDATEQGVILPDIAQGMWSTPTATVIAIGPNVKQVKEGDVVLVNPSTPVSQIKFGREDYAVIHEKHIIGIALHEIPDVVDN